MGKILKMVNNLAKEVNQDKELSQVKAVKQVEEVNQVKVHNQAKVLNLDKVHNQVNQDSQISPVNQDNQANQTSLANPITLTTNQVTNGHLMSWKVNLVTMTSQLSKLMNMAAFVRDFSAEIVHLDLHWMKSIEPVKHTENA